MCVVAWHGTGRSGSPAEREPSHATQPGERCGHGAGGGVADGVAKRGRFAWVHRNRKPKGGAVAEEGVMSK